MLFLRDGLFYSQVILPYDRGYWSFVLIIVHGEFCLFTLKSFIRASCKTWLEWNAALVVLGRGFFKLLVLMLRLPCYSVLLSILFWLFKSSNVIKWHYINWVTCKWDTCIFFSSSAVIRGYFLLLLPLITYINKDRIFLVWIK